MLGKPLRSLISRPFNKFLMSRLLDTFFSQAYNMIYRDSQLIFIVPHMLKNMATTSPHMRGGIFVSIFSSVEFKTNLFLRISATTRLRAVWTPRWKTRISSQNTVLKCLKRLVRYRGDHHFKSIISNGAS